MQNTKIETKSLDKYIVFYVSSGPALCPDCAEIEFAIYPREKQHYDPVYNDGTGNDHYGLVCRCGSSYNLTTGEYIQEQV